MLEVIKLGRFFASGVCYSINFYNFYAEISYFSLMMSKNAYMRSTVLPKTPLLSYFSFARFSLNFNALSSSSMP